MTNFSKWSAWAGIVGALVIAISSLVSMSIYEGELGQAYSPINHFISELGRISVSEGATIFNAGLVIGGSCMGIFIVGLALRVPGILRPILLLIGLTAGISGVLVGIFPMDQIEKHTWVALTFFNAGWMAIALFTVWVLIDHRRQFPRWLAVPGAVTVINFISFLILLGDNEINGVITILSAPEDRPEIWPLTIVEWFVLISILVWVLLLSRVLLRDTSREEPVHEQIRDDT